MNEGRTVFAQLMDSLPRRKFNQYVERYKGNHRVRTFTCLDQYLTMAFAQLTFRESLRDIVTCLRVLDSKLYHAGFRSTVSRSTLAQANEKRSWRIYADLANHLISTARKLYCDEPLAVELAQTVYALDSTTINLCLALFPWATFRKRKGGIKLHTLLDLRGNIPATIIVTTAKTHDVNILDQLPFEPGAFYIFDRAYVDFARLRRIDTARSFFVTRAKRNLDFHRVYSHTIDKSTGLRCDQTIALDGSRSRKEYPGKLRRIVFFDSEKAKRLTFLTNNFELPALSVAQLYKSRWQVELFFKWIKQHLRIKAFYGTSENAVKTQVWIAISVYVLVAIVKKRLRIEASLYTILQILSLSLFEKMPILQAFSQFRYSPDEGVEYKQLDLFDF